PRRSRGPEQTGPSSGLRRPATRAARTGRTTGPGRSGPTRRGPPRTDGRRSLRAGWRGPPVTLTPGGVRHATVRVAALAAPGSAAAGAAVVLLVVPQVEPGAGQHPVAPREQRHQQRHAR